MDTRGIELEPTAPLPADLVEGALAGEIFLVRGCMQRMGLFEEIHEASLEGIRRTAGDELADRVEAIGFDRIHELADLATIAEITDATYAIALERCADWAARIARELFGIDGSFYFERSPNVRYVIPYDQMVKEPDVVERFNAAHGSGKIAPHPCHRDSWVDCPDNLINVWVAVGPIPAGNGLALFPDVYGNSLRHLPSGSIALDEHPGTPLTFDMRPGDAIVFHGDQLHATVLNRTDRTRHAISFRIVRERPHYPNGHYHHYAHSALAGGPLDALAELPANLAASWLRTRVGWLAERIGLRGSAPAIDAGRSVPAPAKDEWTADLAALAPNSLHPVSDRVCLARLDGERVAAFDRRCPHGGADLALGTIDAGEVVCPWHNLRFDPLTGASACQSLRKLRRYPAEVRDGRVSVAVGSEEEAG